MTLPVVCDVLYKEFFFCPQQNILAFNTTRKMYIRYKNAHDILSFW